MIIDLKELLILQKKLNVVIEKGFQIELKNNAMITEKQLLAFIVELGELANETRCFKYWSKKPPSSKKIIEEEYADGLHFLLTIGIDLSWKTTVFQVQPLQIENKKDALVILFNELIQLSSSYFVDLLNHEKYFLILKKYLQLALLLGMKKNDIFVSYKLKNKINHQRQKDNY